VTPPQQPQRPVFRAGTATVPVFVSVTDDAGQFILNLTARDFVVKDNGRPQVITDFITDVQPITAVLLLDASRSMVNALDQVVAGADHFVVRMMPGDKARIGSFSEEIRFNKEFTSNLDELTRQVNDRFDIRIGNRTRLWDAVNEAVTSLEAMDGRRVVLILTDGDDTLSDVQAGYVFRRATRADVTIFALFIHDPKRLPELDPIRKPGNANMRDLMVDTGGGFFDVDLLDDLNPVATQIGLELHSQYVLGFKPASLDGAVHKIDVQVTKPHMKAHARKTYVADARGSGL
jgi:Ca-activated chloride channel homolog